MLCFKCDCEEFVTTMMDVEQIYHGKTYVVHTPVSVCAKCGWQTLAIGQTNELMKNMRKILKPNTIVDKIKHLNALAGETSRIRKEITAEYREEILPFLRGGKVTFDFFGDFRTLRINLLSKNEKKLIKYLAGFDSTWDGVDYPLSPVSTLYCYDGEMGINFHFSENPNQWRQEFVKEIKALGIKVSLTKHQKNLILKIEELNRKYLDAILLESELAS